MRLFFVAGFAVASLCSIAKDPVVMTVDGKDVLKSEFEYLYHKNSRQQLEPQTIDDYVEMFKLYKRKVADAKACGIDTTATFRDEMRQYRRELAAPYLVDSTVIDALVQEALLHSSEEVETSHIMLLKTKDGVKNRRNIQLLDSIRGAIAGGADFGDLAVKYSADGSAKTNRGNLGYIPYGRYPYMFETAAYNLPEGEVSEIVESPVGYHVLLGGKHRPARGKVKVAHIMKMVPRDATDDARYKSEIDSIYDVVTADPDKFQTLASELSDDKGSARQGGMLPVFGPGEMVPEFEAVSYQLKPGETSHPFRSMYGWHIVKKYEDVAGPDADAIRKDVLKAISNPRDDRYTLMKRNRTERLAAKHNASLNLPFVEELSETVYKDGGDGLAERYSGDSFWIAEIDGKRIPASEFIAGLKLSDNNAAGVDISAAADSFFADALVNAEEDWLYENETDYRNLLNEYHDGSLLYEVSLRKVWDKASKDTEGLERYFKEHRNDYKWDAPRAKGYLVLASSDSVAAHLKKRLDGLAPDSVIPVVRKEFAGSAKIERMLVPKGVNATVDHLMFGAPEAKPQDSRYPISFVYQSRLIDSPEEMTDVKGQVTADYQTQLENEWIEELKKKYPVKLNKGVLKKVK